MMQLHRKSDFAASEGAMSVIAALLEQRTGQQIASNRIWRIETTLKPLLRSYDLDSIDALAVELVSRTGSVLAEEVAEALLNQETSFFRDGPVLEKVVEAVLATQARENRRLRVWCAGCSAGQEPYSLAMLFAERLRDDALFPDIVATDISPSVLARARAGRYSQFEIQRGLSVHRMIRWFDTVGEEWIAKPDLVRRVQFRRANLVEDAAPPGRFDLVLCRNVLLYFSGGLRRRVFDIIAGAMRPDALLVLGAGETVIGQTDALVASEAHRGFYRPAG